MSHSDIMIIDDNPANLKILEDMLLQQGYEVCSFPLGRLALVAAARNPPDLILLDINMPEMDGYEVCKRLKSTAELSTIPVIFLSALNETKDKVKAFHSGGVDYITKPFQFEEVQARVDTHIALQRARRAERDLLEKTLNGTIRSLADLIHLTGPALSARSEAIRGIVGRLAGRLDVEDRWQYDLAATLCLIGCISLPSEAFERAYAAGENVSKDEAQMFRAHPENGARLLANIPRMENVSEMIRQQQTASNISSGGTAQRGACMLRVALELDRQALRGASFEVALARVRAIVPGLWQDMLVQLEDYHPVVDAFEIKRLHVHELRPFMVLEEDVVTTDCGLMIVQKGTTLKAFLIERIRNFVITRGINQPIRVRVMRSQGAPSWP